MSVIIPAYRFDHFLDEAVASVLAQSRTDFEIILIDDASPNRAGVDRVRGRFGDRVRFLSRSNGGPAAARNTGIKAAAAPILGFLDEDDLWEPAFLADQLALLEQRPDVDLVYTGAVLFGDASPALLRLMMELSPPNDGEPTLENLLARRCNLTTSAVVGRREVFERTGLFDESLRYAEDFDLWLRMVHAGSRFAHLPQVLLRRRVHGANLTADNARLAEAEVAVLERFAETHALSPGERRALNSRLGEARTELAIERCKACLARGDMRAARRELSAMDRSRSSLKIRLALLVLTVLPGAVGAAYRARERLRRRSGSGGADGDSSDGSASGLRAPSAPSAGTAGRFESAGSIGHVTEPRYGTMHSTPPTPRPVTD